MISLKKTCFIDLKREPKKFLPKKNNIPSEALENGKASDAGFLIYIFHYCFQELLIKQKKGKLI